MSRFTIDELVQRMAKLSLQDNSVDKTSTGENAQNGSLYNNEDIEMLDYVDISRNEVALQGA
ncbi:hypothetical protein ARSEF1564_003401 [Beauveria bassiana]